MQLELNTVFQILGVVGPVLAAYVANKLEINTLKNTVTFLQGEVDKINKVHKEEIGKINDGHKELVGEIKTTNKLLTEVLLRLTRVEAKEEMKEKKYNEAK